MLYGDYFEGENQRKPSAKKSVRFEEMGEVEEDEESEDGLDDDFDDYDGSSGMRLKR